MEEKDLDLTCGLTDDELTERFKESIRVDNEFRTILGLPIAKFDPDSNKAYLEYPDGKKEYVDDPHRAFKTDDYSLTVDKSGDKDSLKHILMNELLTTDDRPEFLRMIEDSENGLFNLVIVHNTNNA